MRRECCICLQRRLCLIAAREWDSPMYESSLFSDPVFLVTWQVHLAVVILFSLLGLWWGASRQAWYLGPLLLCLGLWLFIPIEAPEPVIVLLIYVPLLAL